MQSQRQKQGLLVKTLITENLFIKRCMSKSMKSWFQLLETTYLKKFKYIYVCVDVIIEVALRQTALKQ